MSTSLKFKILRVVISLILIVFASLTTTEPISSFTLLLWLSAFAIGGYDKAMEGWKNTLKDKSLNVEFLMILAAVAAFITQDFAEGSILIFIFATSGILEEIARSKSEKALKALLELTPQKAIKVQNGIEKEVNISELSIHDIVMVKVGQQVPVDGIIVEGSSSFNESVITGEYLPVLKHEHDSVYAGSINEEATILIQVLVDPTQSVVNKIVEFVKEAQEKKTKSETFIDRFESVYVYVVLAISASFMVLPPLFGWLSWSDAFYRGVIVLVVGSPCAVVASITPAILSSLSNAASKGILIKGGESLENLHRIKVIMFDKTGTITQGKPRVDHVVYSDGVDKHWINSLLVSMEQQSSHPLAKAIVNHFKDVEKLDLSTREEAGYGLITNYENHTIHVGRYEGKDACQLNLDDDVSVVNVVVDEHCVARVILKDQLREGVPQTMASIKKLGITPVLVSGDREGSVVAMAKLANIDRMHFECLPQDKVKIIESYQSSLGAVMMVGDGINDAPSLAIATIGVAMGSATDVSLETADVVLTQNSLEALIKLKHLAKNMNTIIRQNLAFSILVIVSLMISNVFGLVELPQGVLAHELSTIIVILNSLRLLKVNLASS
ncbi:MAG: cadmium-translocating P-type ATPase [Erysipelotrichia bacterium]|jgi:Cd2+/Zn2+-exporting ATPase|nr:cadmium-translocating P-type ATPase [Erysipelotrichia bacterium]